MISKEVSGEAGKPEAAEERLVILFGDIAGSTRLEAEAGDLSFVGALEQYFRRVDQVQAAHRGRIAKTFGDGFMAVFKNAADALNFGIALQGSLTQDPIRVAGHQLRIRIGLHVGPVFRIRTSYGDDVLGQAINLAARLTSLAQPGELVMSEAVRVELPEDQQPLLGDSERLSVKGVQDLVEIRRLKIAGV